MKKELLGLTKGTELEKIVDMVANAEAAGAKHYYAVARMSRQQGLPAEIADRMEGIADQESNHAGFYAMLNAEYPEDIYAQMEHMAKGEHAAGKALMPLADKLRALGSEEAAGQVEEFVSQEIRHGDILDELLKKYGKRDDGVAHECK